MYTPSKLIIIDGELHMKDGSSVKDYLQSWQNARGTPNGTKVNVFLHSHTNELLCYEQLVLNG